MHLDGLNKFLYLFSKNKKVLRIHNEPRNQKSQFSKCYQPALVSASSYFQGYLAVGFSVSHPTAYGSILGSLSTRLPTRASFSFLLKFCHRFQPHQLGKRKKKLLNGFLAQWLHSSLAIEGFKIHFCFFYFNHYQKQKSYHSHVLNYTKQTGP